jgi:hypothetical protein
MQLYRALPVSKTNVLSFLHALRMKAKDGIFVPIIPVVSQSILAKDKDGSFFHRGVLTEGDFEGNVPGLRRGQFWPAPSMSPPSCPGQHQQLTKSVASQKWSKN